MQGQQKVRILDSFKHIVGVSGGIDSQAALRWVRNHYGDENVIALNSNAGGNEHPITDTFVADYSANVFPVTVVSAIVGDIDRPGPIQKAAEMGLSLDTTLTFDLLATLKGFFPSSRFQFCTEFLKLAPQRRWMKANVTDDYERYSGVRREESERRKNTPFRCWDSYFDCYLNCPIADWTKQMCFDYVKQYGEPVNPLYSLGFDHVGCAPCVNSDKEDIHRWSIRAPEMIDKVERWEESTGLCFFRSNFPGKTNGRVREVVEWAATDYGGRQFNILTTIQPATCESKYGLCE
jgi:3'-phosphoadenosine 5'-phosphosulfate sulfotransferase (PAPS reductase)/FAD synthetase